MNKLAMVIVALAAACGGKKSENSGETVGAKKPTDTTTCPMPTAKDAQDERFAVGSIPVARVEGLYHGARCHDTFIPNEVVKVEGKSFRVVAEGTFQGHCEDEPSNKRTYEAVKPAKAIIEVQGLAMHEAELGVGKPVLLDSNTPDKHSSIRVSVVDRCGATLEGEGEATWELGAGCDKVAKLESYTEIRPADPKAREMKVLPIGPGTCTISVTMFGAKGETTVTVK